MKFSIGDRVIEVCGCGRCENTVGKVVSIMGKRYTIKSDSGKLFSTTGSYNDLFLYVDPNDILKEML